MSRNEIEAAIAEKKEALASVKGTETEVFARIVGYYRPVSKWNKGKKQEFSDRKTFNLESA